MLALMFSGQGSQYIGMGKELYESFPCCRAVFEQANKCLGYSVSDICFYQNDLLDKTEYTQPAVFTVSAACLALLTEQGLIKSPHAVLGLSLGEYTALYAAGALSFAETVTLLAKRGRYMTEAVPENTGIMSAVIGLSREQVEEICEGASLLGVVSPANYNMPGQIVIAGNRDAVAAAEEAAVQLGGRCVRLKVSGPFHTSLLAPAAKKLEAALEELQLGQTESPRSLAMPVISNVTARPIGDVGEIKDILVRQIMSPVFWEDSIRYLIGRQVDTFIELGPGKTLCSFVRKIDRNVKTLHMENMKSYENVKEYLREAQ